MRVANGIVEEAKELWHLMSYLDGQDEVASLTRYELDRFMLAEREVRNLRAGMRILADKLRPLYDEVRERKAIENLSWIQPAE